MPLEHLPTDPLMRQVILNYFHIQAIGEDAERKRAVIRHENWKAKQYKFQSPEQRLRWRERVIANKRKKAALGIQSPQTADTARSIGPLRSEPRSHELPRIPEAAGRSVIGGRALQGRVG